MPQNAFDINCIITFLAATEKMINCLEVNSFTYIDNKKIKSPKYAYYPIQVL